jgi:hypothetical protein
VTILAAQIPDNPTALANNAAITDADSIGLTWSAPVFDGGSALIDYTVEYDAASSGVTFTELASGLTDTSYTATGLTQGLTYQFKVKARNSYGFSLTYSSIVSILTAQPPAQPSAPVTTWSPDDVVVTWTAPDDGGSPITGYTVSILQSDADYSVDLTNCDMSSSTAVTCTIPVTALRTTPYSLEWGSSVFAKVIATNAYGNSVESTAGNGATITTTPDVATSIVEVDADRTKSTLGLSWTAPVFTGGDVIIDYQINIAEQGGSFSILESVSTSTYTAISLTAGTTYEFKIESRNSYGFSSYSDVITLLCAFIADPPVTVTTANVNELVTITWSEPVSNGSPITAYRIYVRQSDTTTFTEETVDCVGTESTVITDKTCSISLATLKASPYLLVKDDSVVATIVSVNVYGESSQSSEGSGAVI